MICDNYTTTIKELKWAGTGKKKKKSPSKLDAEYDQDISVSNVFALISVWRNDFNNEDEETINEEEKSGEDLVQEAANQIHVNKRCERRLGND